MTGSSSVVALSGGVGGAKLALGLYRHLGRRADQLTLVVNTGDDFDHLGLRICPDLDTALYTLSELADPVRGWGRRDETWQFMAALTQLGGPDWFRLGDADLALHTVRTRHLAAGKPLSAVMQMLAERLGIRATLLPMTDDTVATVVDTTEGELPFQNYFVEQQCRPAVRGLRYLGAESAAPSPGVLEALANPALRAVIIAPSNPFLSIDPMLAIPAVRQALVACRAPVVAVSPVIAGKAVKGPTVKIMGELGLASSAAAVAHHYRDVIDGFLLDERDAGAASAIGSVTALADTMMRSLEDRERVAAAALALADRIRCDRGATRRCPP